MNIKYKSEENVIVEDKKEIKKADDTALKSKEVKRRGRPKKNKDEEA